MSQVLDMPPPGTKQLSEWPAHLRAELEANLHNGMVGSVLVSETDRVRVWHLHLPPGKRCNFHRHVNDYFWSAHFGGRARGYYADGRVVDVEHFKGETKHFKFGAGEFFVHSVENIGASDLLFTTVEFLDGANRPLDVPPGARLQPPATA